LNSSQYNRKTIFTSFDGSFSASTIHQKPDRFRMLENEDSFQIARGAGLSYTPASFGNDVIVKEMSCFNRILEFQESERIVIVEAGITLKKLLEWSVTKNLYLSVLPGWPGITIGGCIAANAHGKNPHKDGSFVEHVKWIELYNPSFGYKTVSRTNDPKIFEATCGGLGLTGIITKVALFLKDLPSNSLVIEPRKVESFEESLKIMKSGSNSDVLYSWHIGSTFFNFGKGIVRIGSFSKDLQSGKVISSIKKLKSGNKMIPFSFWNNFSSSIINTINREIESKKGKVKKNLFSGLFPFVDRASIFYSLYGMRGFNEYQILVDHNHSNEFISELCKLIKTNKPPLTFLFMKMFRGEQKYVRFSKNGLSIILNLKHCKETLDFLNKLDELVISFNVMPYIIKDSRLSKKVVEQCYPQYHDFKEILNQIDPKRIFKSELSKRLEL